MAETFCKTHDCPWYDSDKHICGSPNDPCGGECDFDWATKCPKCHKLIAVGDDEDNECPYCGAILDVDIEQEEPMRLIEKRHFDHKVKTCEKVFFCSSCGIKIRTELWKDKQHLLSVTLLKDNTMPTFCPNCGRMIQEKSDIELETS